MHHEEGCSHLARQDESDGAGKQADQQEQAAEEFKNAGHQHQWRQGVRHRVCRWRIAK